MCKCKFGKCPDSCECRCHIAIEAHRIHSYKVGTSSGLQQAAGVLLTEATEAFTLGRDEEAQMLRKLANQLSAQSKKEHPGPHPSYEEE